MFSFILNVYKYFIGLESNWKERNRTTLLIDKLISGKGVKSNIIRF